MEKNCSPFRLSPRVCKESNKCKQRHAQTHVHHIERRNFHFLFLKERKTRKKMEKKGKKEKENTRKGKINVIGSVCAQNTNLANSSIRGLRGKTKEERDAQCHPRSPGALYLAWKYYVNVIVSKDLVNVKDGHLRHVNLSQRGEPSMICKVATLSGCPVCHAVSCAASSVCDGCHRAVSCRILSS